jgi:hypothetical protein
MLCCFQDDLKLGKLLGSGGFGSVYKATLTEEDGTQTPVVVKKVRIVWGTQQSSLPVTNRLMRWPFVSVGWGLCIVGWGLCTAEFLPDKAHIVALTPVVVDRVCVGAENATGVCCQGGGTRSRFRRRMAHKHQWWSRRCVCLCVCVCVCVFGGGGLRQTAV